MGGEPCWASACFGSEKRWGVVVRPSSRTRAAFVAAELGEGGCCAIRGPPLRGAVDARSATAGVPTELALEKAVPATRPVLAARTSMPELWAVDDDSDPMVCGPGWGTRLCRGAGGRVGAVAGMPLSLGVVTVPKRAGS